MVIIGTPSQHLVLTATGNRDVLRATVVAQGLRAELDVWAFSATDVGVTAFGDLVRFFESMEEDWRGWAGERAWLSLEGELTLTARHLGSTVVVAVELHSFLHPADGNWQASLEIRVDAGAQLSAIAGDLRALVAQP